MTRGYPRRHDISGTHGVLDGVEAGGQQYQETNGFIELHPWNYWTPSAPDNSGDYGNSRGTLESSYTSDDDLIFYEDVYEEEGPLEPNHPFQVVRKELGRFATTEVEAWEAQYFRSGIGGRLGRGRARQFQGVNSPRLSCPYYKRDPRRFLSCLKKYDIRTVKELKQHLWTVHRQPSYCPTCYETFAQGAERDEHVRRRSCRERRSQVVEGITSKQRTLLARREDPSAGLEDQWFRIWDIVFPNWRHPGTAYLHSSLEKGVCRLRAFWESEGQRVVGSFLRARGLLNLDLPDEERSLSILYGSILEDLINARVAAAHQRN